MHGRAFAATAGGCASVTLTLNLAASVYAPAAVTRFHDPQRWTFGNRWVEFDTLTASSIGLKVTGRLHQLPGDDLDMTSAFLGHGGRLRRQHDAAVPGPRHIPVHDTFAGGHVSLPASLASVRLTLTGCTVFRSRRVPAHVSLPVSAGGEVLARPNGATPHLVGLRPRGATVRLTAHGPPRPRYPRLAVLSTDLQEPRRFPRRRGDPDPGGWADAHRCDTGYTERGVDRHHDTRSVTTLHLAWKRAIAPPVATRAVLSALRPVTHLALTVPTARDAWPARP